MFIKISNPTQVSSGVGPTATSSSLTLATSPNLTTTTSTASPLASTISTETLVSQPFKKYLFQMFKFCKLQVNSFQALSSIESGEMMQPLHSYFGQPDMSIPEGFSTFFIYFKVNQVLENNLL